LDQVGQGRDRLPVVGGDLDDSRGQIEKREGFAALLAHAEWDSARIDSVPTRPFRRPGSSDRLCLMEHIEVSRRFEAAPEAVWRRYSKLRGRSYQLRTKGTLL